MGFTDERLNNDLETGVKNGYLHKVKLEGSYSNIIVFPSNTSSLKTYTLKLIAETVGNVKTIHQEVKEVRNEDNSINLNKSTHILET